MRSTSVAAAFGEAERDVERRADVCGSAGDVGRGRLRARAAHVLWHDLGRAGIGRADTAGEAPAFGVDAAAVLPVGLSGVALAARCSRSGAGLTGRLWPRAAWRSR